MPASPVGSFDVRILETKSEDSNGPKLGRAPSLGALLRVDFPSECDALSGGGGASSAVATPCVLRPDWVGKVLVTVQGSAPTAYEATRVDRALILDTDGTRASVEGAVPLASAAGAAGASGQGATYFTTDRWQRFTFPLDAQGRVVPPVQAQAVQYIDLGNGQPTIGTKLSANASFLADRTAPRAEVVVGSSFSPPGLQFPWDPITVHFDEPIVLPEPGDVIVTTPVDGSAIPSLLWRWAPAESDVPDSLLKTFGATWYQGYWRGWDASPLDNTVRLGTFRDPSSNAGLGLEQKLKLAAPSPNAAPVHDFEGDVSGMVLWGGAAFDATGCEPAAPGPANTRCVRFSFDNAACGLSEPAGLALRLEAPASVDPTALLLTARLRVDVAVPDTTSVKLTQISAQVLWAGAQKPQYKELEVSPGSWVDVSKELDPPPVIEPPSAPPTNPRDVAIVLRSGGLFSADACRQSVGSNLPTIITIESIAVSESSTR
ncbi:MAG: hypothetical protein MUF34_19430 [Polyangiaceae bacterium]|nr:hypothetical protein [Polyangiaceae bacterium]